MKRNPTKIHGYISISLILIAFLIGTISIAHQSPLTAGIYILLIPIAFTVVSVAYCAKCPCREECNHYFIGKLSLLLSKPRSGGYTFMDIVITAVPLLVIIAYPQPWLANNLWFQLAFWGLIAFAGLEIYLYVCKTCSNTK